MAVTAQCFEFDKAQHGKIVRLEETPPRFSQKVVRKISSTCSQQQSLSLSRRSQKMYVYYPSVASAPRLSRWRFSPVTRASGQPWPLSDVLNFKVASDQTQPGSLLPRSDLRGQEDERPWEQGWVYMYVGWLHCTCTCVFS